MANIDDQVALEKPEKLQKLIRLSRILAPAGPVPVARSTWWAGVKSGRFPKPVKLGPRIVAWRADDIAALIRGGTT